MRVGTVVVVCQGCGAPLTGSLMELSALPVLEQHEDGIGFEPTIPRGRLAVDPEPVARCEDGTPTSALGCLVVNPQDVLALEEHPDSLRNSGCCGHDGLEGPNRLCPRCGSEVATLRDDCWTPVDLRFEPQAVALTRLNT